MEGLEPALVAILVQLKDGTLGAAGTELWQSLRAIIKKRQKGANVPQLDGEALAADAPALGEALASAAETDPVFAEDLAKWLSQARSASISMRGDVNNNVSGPVSGTVIQIGNVGRDRGG